VHRPASLLLLTLLLLAAAAGTATAARRPSRSRARTISGALIRKGTITGAQIRKGTITAAQIRKGTITAEQIKPGSLTRALLAAGVLPVLTPTPQVDAYTKAQSDARYMALGTAVDAATLDGLDSSAFQRGSSQASGRQVAVPGAGRTTGILFSVNGLDVEYSCSAGSTASIDIHPQAGVTFGFATGQAFGGGATTYSQWDNASVPISFNNSEGHFMVSDPVAGTGAGGSLVISIDATATINGSNCEFAASADIRDTRAG
jgi:hypothetical protein